MSDSDFLRSLRIEVEKAIDRYVYSIPDGALGSPWSAGKVTAMLKEMKQSLVDPYWTTVELRDTLTQISLKQPLIRKCAAVADDGRYLLLWDPQEDGYLLAELTDKLPFSFGVRGDAVGCFFSR